MRNFCLALIGLLVVETALAVPVAINRRDVKFPSQQMVEKQEFTNPIASNWTYIKSAYAGSTSAAVVTLTSFAAQPDVARNLEITPGGTTGDIEDCLLVVNGTDYLGHSLSENFQFVANQATKVVGAKAFKTVTSVVWPASCESGSFAATWSIGVGERLGLKRCMGNAADIFFSVLNTSKEGTAPTMQAHSTILASNWADFNGTMNGTNDFILYFMQNFNCF